MSLRLYLDECCAARTLRELLVRAGHNVETPIDVRPSLIGAADKAQLTHATATERLLLTTNPDHFQRLHESHPNHFGVIGVYQDGNRAKDMTWPEVVKALANLESTGMDLRGTFVILNKYRW